MNLSIKNNNLILEISLNEVEQVKNIIKNTPLQIKDLSVMEQILDKTSFRTETIIKFVSEFSSNKSLLTKLAINNDNDGISYFLFNKNLSVEDKKYLVSMIDPYKLIREAIYYEHLDSIDSQTIQLLLDLITKLNVVNSQPSWVWKTLLLNPNCPDEQREQIIKLINPDIRSLLFECYLKTTKNPNVHKQYVNHKASFIREYLAQNPNISNEIVQTLFIKNQKNYAILFQLFRNPVCPAALKLQLKNILS